MIKTSGTQSMDKISLLCCLALAVTTAPLQAQDTPVLADPSGEDPCDSKAVYGGTWLDRTHDYLARNAICEPVVWFDSFFGDERFEEESLPTSFVRWRNDFRWDERDGFEYRTQLLSSIHLPKATRKLRLIITGESDENITEIIPEELGEIGGAGRDEDNRLDVGLRYTVIEKPKSSFNLQASVRFDFPLEPFARARYRYTHPLSDRSLARLTQTLFWEREDGFGETTRLDLERLLDERTLLRWANAATFSESTDGVEWGSNLGWFRQFDLKTAVNVDVGAEGETRPDYEVTNYRITARYRRNFYRPWLFYELVPEVYWPLDEDTDERDTVTAFTLRLEVQFDR